jgi:hypothetical protein
MGVTTEAGVSNGVCTEGTLNTTRFYSTATPVSGVQASATITSPAINTNWQVWSTRYVSGIAPVTKINNVAVAPTYAVASGLADDVDRIHFGHPTLAGGSTYLRGIFENVGTAPGSACLSEEGAILYYIGVQTGIFT